ncbi:acyltransferase [Agathobacter sp. LCP21S3_B2]|uniref:acyltransferase n=1 Tax=Agathobacter sp. LCP21S3_B2 TaxID=3438734 RepID=UPI003F906F67
MKYTIIDIIKAKIRGTINLKQLEKDGFRYGRNFDIQYGVIIDPGHCWLIEIGDNVTLAPRVHILAHDASMKKFLGYTKIAPVKIGNNVFIGAGSIVLPGVTIGNNVIIGAGSVVTKSLESGNVYGGVPAKKISTIDEYLDKINNLKKNNVFFDETYIIGNISDEKKESMKKILSKNGIGFIV